MKTLKILIDPSYPTHLIKSLESIHSLQVTKRIEIHRWSHGIENKFSLNESVFLSIDESKKGLSESTLKHLEDGYRMFVMKPAKEQDFFEFAMTVLRVWPLIIEKSKSLNIEKFCYTFRYGGKKLNRIKGITIC
ncbi:hypothetical protein [Cognataquiflexum rubidum]|uniref:hypothetical protein n=1 Tax=Cognataquiflexum rubidum TaxID=2922273 RepID=UPI001F12C804|nr:hypothetical protein [Cognataquiflexum rubidum]MCH6236663.1 hypothetical protein [Cognataquiflexum rubidum]